jgi:3-oxoacyl-[acyl-carrier protein] reductase
MGLENKVVVISGASGGLGQVVTQAMAEQGARLVLLGRNIGNLKALASQLSLAKDQYQALAVDLNNPKDAEEAADSAIQKFGRADVLLHLVGMWGGGATLVDVDLEDIKNMLQQHLWTTLHLTQAFVPHFLKNGWGRVIAISSPSAANPSAKGGPYAIGKAAQETLLLTLAKELKGSGVTANIIRVKAIDMKHARLSTPSPQNTTWTLPEEISDAILYLISDGANMVNGAQIPLYGSP